MQFEAGKPKTGRVIDAVVVVRHQRVVVADDRDFDEAGVLALFFEFDEQRAGGCTLRTLPSRASRDQKKVLNGARLSRANGSPIVNVGEEV